MNKEDVLKAIRVHIAIHHNGKQRLFAESVGVSGAYVSAVLTGSKLPTPKILEAVGLKMDTKKVIVYSQL